MKNWSMLAVNFEECKTNLVFPLMGQPKLNGIRACWDGGNLWSRQGKGWKENTLPHIYAKLLDWSRANPGVILDGELYSHGMSFQEIEARTSINRQAPHVDCAVIEYHAFDIISSADTESRQITLSQIYKLWTPVCKVENFKDVDIWLNRFYESGFEGLMLRQYGSPYTPGRSELLVKVKPWTYGRGIIAGFIEGEGKYKGMLGAIRIDSNGTFFNVSGGLSDEQRKEIWNNQVFWMNKIIEFKYRNLSNSNKPLQPQIVSL